ncbi:protein-tyrosine sulfotransferase-like [Bidens hawaiensis]
MDNGLFTQICSAADTVGCSFLANSNLGKSTNYKLNVEAPGILPLSLRSVCRIGRLLLLTAIRYQQLCKEHFPPCGYYNVNHNYFIDPLISGLPTVYPSSGALDFEHCKNSIKQWSSSSLHSNTNNGHILKDLLFFLHIPRTGGRTYFHCFLKKLYSGELECPRSYDKLRFDPRKPDCRLLATHDDYSMMSKLPADQTSVVTILRDPVERVFSTYEFSIEVAARFLVHSNLTSVMKMSKRVRSKSGGVSTLEIWPWKYLVPWMQKDLFSRRDARKRRGRPYFYGNDSYDMQEVVMPLHDYINHPVARDIIHNGATFQV